MRTSVALISLVASATAHSFFQQLYVNGVSPGRGVGIRMPVSNSPIMSVDSPDLGCNVTPGSSSFVISVPAGASLTTEWHQTTDPSQYGTGDDPIAASHHGPVSTWVAKCDNATTASPQGLRWTKIHEEGFFPDTKSWAVDKMIANKGKIDFRVPSCLGSGHYLLRQEIIALHAASTYPGAQFYMSCAQIQITGGGSAFPEGVGIPGAYQSSDPGITLSIDYPPVTSYDIPGPRPFTCDGETATAPTTPPVTSTPPPLTTTTSPPAPGGTAELYGQCGGAEYSGPTACPSGSVCEVQNQYYFQCLPVAASPRLAEGAVTPGAAPTTHNQFRHIGEGGWSVTTACPSDMLCAIPEIF